MQLRKAIGHPYLFPGIEPEPFEMGEHLSECLTFSVCFSFGGLFSVEASGKLHILDHLLAHLYAKKHKVLLFSQFTSVLDILQDYLTYRETYKYERNDRCTEGIEVTHFICALGLDGSVRSEERFLAINNFNSNDDTFIFLLSTKAGEYCRTDNVLSSVTIVSHLVAFRWRRPEPCCRWHGDFLRFGFQSTKWSASCRSMPSYRTNTVKDIDFIYWWNDEVFCP